nr:putative reverse transcriptase domain-containing protein [Tanacetum cinerariifolium]
MGLVLGCLLTTLSFLKKSSFECLDLFILMDKILPRVGLVAYMLEFPKQLKRIHSTFHFSNLKKRLAKGDIIVPVNEIQLDDKLHMIEEPVEVVDREVNRARGAMDTLVVVFWMSHA